MLKCESYSVGSCLSLKCERLVLGQVPVLVQYDGDQGKPSKKKKTISCVMRINL